jgi:hypothetical protein
LKIERFDNGSTGQVERLPNGFLRLPITATRFGIFVYKDGLGGEWRELRPEEEVFAADSMGSLRGVPLTNEHPVHMVDISNAQELMVGYTSDSVNRDGKHIKTFGTLTHKPTIDQVETGSKVEVSCGYDCELEFTPGSYKGQRYDAIQRNIRYNHIAIVKKGRAGPEARLHLDSAGGATERVMRLDSVIDFDEDASNPEAGEHTNDNGDNMKILVINGVEHKLDEAAYDAVVARFKADSDAIEAAKSEAATVKAEVSTLTAKCDSLTDELKTAKESRMDADTINQKVEARMKLVRFAEKHLKADAVTGSDMDIIEKLIQKKNPDFKKDGKDEAYMLARLDHMMETEKDAPGGAYQQARGDSADRVNGSSGKESSADIRARKQREDADAWKTPLKYASK